MGDFFIENTESGWTVIKDGATYTVTDTNNNGRYDSTDKIIFGDQSANPLSAEDRAEIKFSIMKADPEGMTDAEMAQYAQFVETKEYQQKLEEEQARLQEERQAAQWAAQQPKKKGFWEKFATVLGFTAPVLTGVGAGFIGAGSNSWQYNSGDSGLRWMSGIAAGLSGFTASFASMMPFIMGSQTQSLTSSLNLNSLLAQPTVPSTTNFDSLYSRFLTDVNNTPSIEQQEQRAQQARAQYAEQIRERFKDNDLIPDSNKNKLMEIAPPSKGSSEYTEQDEKTLRQLAATPYVPVNVIDIDDTEETAANKISTELAEKINKAITDFIKASASTDQEYHNYKQNISKLQDIIGDGSVTKDDIKLIDKILMNLKSQIKDSGIDYNMTSNEE